MASADFAKKLTFKTNSENYSIYTDGSGNCVDYYFDSDGGFVGIMAPAGLSDYKKAILKGEAKGISISEAKEIALKTAKTLFGNVIDDMTSVECVSDRDDKFSIRISKNYGKNGFIEGYSCNVSIHSDGAVGSCLMRDGEAFASFDSSLVEDLEQKLIEEYAVQKVTERCPDYTSLKIEQFYMTSEYGEYVVRTVVEVSAPQVPAGDDVRPAWLHPEQGEDFVFSVNVDYVIECSDAKE